jgi:predicted HAD superfamily phosphohydrolase YqeG
MHYFEDLPTLELHHKTIILDIDGTLAADGETTVSERAKAHAALLSQSNFVILCSNKKNTKRNTAISKMVGIPYLDTPFRKPSKKILHTIELNNAKDVVVVGDKFLTDGIFAWRINATFIKVKRVRASRESFFTVCTYLLDDACYAIAQFFGYKH